MTNTFKKSLLFIFTCLLASTAWGQTNSFSAADIAATSSKGSVTVSTTFSLKSSAQICKEGSTATKVEVIEGKETASSVDEKYVEIKSTSDISKLTLHATYNSSGSGKQMAFVYWGENATPDINNVLSAELITFVGYDGACDANYVDVTLPAGVQTIRIYRQLKTFNGTGYDKNAKYGDGQTFFIADIDVTAGPAVPVTGVSVQPATLELEAGQTSTLTATVAPENATNKKVTWSSDNITIASVSDAGVVQGESVGTTKIIATTEDGGKTAECIVTVKAATPVPVTGISLSDLSVQVGASASVSITYTPSNANTGKTCTWTSSDESVAVVNNGTVTGKKEGTATITATSQDYPTIKATCTVTVTTATPVPQTDLTLHEPEIYEAKSIAGGYDGTLTNWGGREYEVYYMTRDAESEFCIATTNADKTTGITTRGANDYTCTANDGWFKFSGTGWSSSSDAMGDEFGTMARRLDMDKTCEFTLHIKGFDQFSLVARDKKKDTSSGQTKPADNKYLEVYIDDVLQPLQFNSSPSIRRYDVSATEHVIRVKHFGEEKSAMYAFSLRVSDQPRTKHITGNDSTQVIRQTETPKAISYFTKYASKGETKLVWDGPEATGIKLSKQASGELGDTLILSGKALCPVGTYKYAVVATYNGVETNRATGKFSVTTGITALSDTIIDAYQEEQIDEIRFRCYAYEKDSVTIEWKDNNQPEGIQASFNTSNYIYSITGTPTSPEGIYEYRVGVKGGNSIPGKITIRAISYDNAIMYLYKNNHAQEKDNAYKYLTDELHKNIILRRSDFEAKLRPAEQYDKYDFIFISSDVDANNEEVLDIIRGKINKPVLNMKAFTYAPGRMDSLGWGEPDNGSLDTLTHCGQYIYIQRNDHPIFQKAFSGKKLGDSIKILNNNETRGLMPIKITQCPNSLPLATAYTRDINDYFANGPKQTILHEIPVGSELRNGNSNKYICFPLSSSEPDNLTSDGKKLLDAVVDYLLDSNVPSISIPELAITSFTLNGVQGTIDGDSIVVKLNADETDSTYQYSYTLADPVLTHVLPARGDSIDFSFCRFAPVGIVVTDYINRRPYNVIVQFYSLHGIDEVYTAGEWVNIYDIFGRMITTTNQDIYRMDLPHGMYIVVTANGGTLKIMK